MGVWGSTWPSCRLAIRPRNDFGQPSWVWGYTLLQKYFSARGRRACPLYLAVFCSPHRVLLIGGAAPGLTANPASGITGRREEPGGPVPGGGSGCKGVLAPTSPDPATSGSRVAHCAHGQVVARFVRLLWYWCGQWWGGRGCYGVTGYSKVSGRFAQVVGLIGEVECGSRGVRFSWVVGQ